MAVLWLAIAVGGCAAIRATVSVPRVPAGATGEVKDEVLRLTLPGFTLSTHMYNYHPTERLGQPPLGLWLALDVQDNDFTFDPGLVTLRADNEEPAPPSTIIGPATPWKSPRSVGMGCGPRRYALGWAWHKVAITDDDLKYGNAAKGIWKRSRGPVPLKGSTCFVLLFDTSPDPGRTFVLSVRGAKKAGEPFLIPDITFSKGSVRKFVTVP